MTYARNSINWGDGTTSSAYVQPDTSNPGTFDVVVPDGHTYIAPPPDMPWSVTLSGYNGSPTGNDATLYWTNNIDGASDGGYQNEPNPAGSATTDWIALMTGPAAENLFSATNGGDWFLVDQSYIAGTACGQAMQPMTYDSTNQVFDLDTADQSGSDNQLWGTACDGQTTLTLSAAQSLDAPVADSTLSGNVTITDTNPSCPHSLYLYLSPDPTSITASPGPNIGSGGTPVVMGEPAGTLTLATFTDSSGDTNVNDFSAYIDWGDGSDTTGTISPNGGGSYTVTGSPNGGFAAFGTLSVNVCIGDPNGGTASVTDTANVVAVLNLQPTFQSANSSTQSWSASLTWQTAPGASQVINAKDSSVADWTFQAMQGVTINDNGSAGSGLENYSATVPGLIYGDTYQFNVQVNGTGTSAQSDTVSLTPSSGTDPSPASAVNLADYDVSGDWSVEFPNGPRAGSIQVTSTTSPNPGSPQTILMYCSSFGTSSSYATRSGTTITPVTWGGGKEPYTIQLSGTDVFLELSVSDKYYYWYRPYTAPLPAAPSNLTATSVNGNEIDLAWNDNSNNETGFTVYRGLTAEFSQATAIGNSPADEPWYQDTSVPDDQLYYYFVVANGGAAPALDSLGADVPTTTSQPGGPAPASLVKLSSLQFIAAGSDPTASSPEQIDKDYSAAVFGQPYTGPEWANGKELAPVAYAAGALPRLTISLNGDMQAGANWQIEGIGDLVIFGPHSLQAGNNNTLTATGDAENNIPANDILSRDEKIDWRIQYQPGGQWTDVGTTTTWMYITGGSIPAGTQYHLETVIATGCQAVSGGLHNDEDVFLDLERAFQSLKMYHIVMGKPQVNTHVLTYWGPISQNGKSIVPPNFNTVALLRDSSGRCGDWASFFLNVLADQGVPIGGDTDLLDITPKAGNFPLPPGNNIPAGTVPGFYVPPAAFPAQGNPIPNNCWFQDHAIVSFHETGTDWFIFDPSYGGAVSNPTSLKLAEQAWAGAALYQPGGKQGIQGEYGTQSNLSGTRSAPFAINFNNLTFTPKPPHS